MTDIPQQVLNDIFAHADACKPLECCGFLVKAGAKVRYVRAVNCSPEPNGFVMAPTALIDIEKEGTPVALVHSHVNMKPEPSQPDRVACNISGMPWLIVAVPTYTTQWLYPDEYEAPYEERVFAHAVLDCYTLAEDWYRRELGITLPRRSGYDYDTDWWHHNKHLYSKENIVAAGFHLASAPFKLHDLHFMQLDSPTPNHIAIQLDGVHILHHLQGRLSGKTVYGGYWQKHTIYTARHESQR